MSGFSGIIILLRLRQEKGLVEPEDICRKVARSNPLSGLNSLDFKCLNPNDQTPRWWQWAADRFKWATPRRDWRLIWEQRNFPLQSERTGSWSAAASVLEYLRVDGKNLRKPNGCDREVGSEMPFISWR